MSKQLIIKDHRTLINALHYIQEQTDYEWPIDVTIKPHEANRSNAQNRLYWLRNTEIGKYLGHLPDEVHLMSKEKFVVPIMMRDSESYNEMVQSVKAVRAQGMTEQADALKKEIVRLTSTTELTVKQMAEVLENQELWAGEIGAEITFPSDLMQEALGRKKK